jgi:DNA-binding response OmpR family regulator
MAHILIVEDNTDVALGLRLNLELEGHAVDHAADGAVATELLRARAPDLVVLDLMLPNMDGFQVLEQLRDGGMEMPVLILSARQEERDKVRGFRIGADDYVTKPFGLHELLARIEALLRRSRSRSPAADVVRFGTIEVRPKQHTVTRGGAPVTLRPKELELLLALVDRRGETVSRVELLRQVWGHSDDVVSRTIDTHMAELRRKLEENPASPRHLLSIRKVGYRLQM